jgi:membrane-associated protease RseP (regulator of RpoE activity)
MNSMIESTSKFVNWSLGFVAALALVAVWHESGHFLVAWLYRVPIKQISVGFGPVLWRHTLSSGLRLQLRALPLGMAIGVVGRRTPEGCARRPLEDDLGVAAGGPLASLILAVLCITLAISRIWWPVSWLGMWLMGAGLLSALLMLLNLLPIPGLDGGHLVLLHLAQRGWQLSPEGEASVHRRGLQAVLGACILLAFVVLTRTA